MVPLVEEARAAGGAALAAPLPWPCHQDKALGRRLCGPRFHAVCGLREIA